MRTKLCERHPDCPTYKMGDKVVIIDKRHHKRIRVFVCGASWSNNHFMLMHKDGDTKTLHPYSWLQFRLATKEEEEKGERIDV